jgi:formylmethanofuran dehydrogenase subunit C
MALRLIYRGETPIPVEVEGLTPTWASDKSLADIERFEIFHGNKKTPLGEMFSVTGNASDKRLEFEGDLSGVHWIGSQMSEGQIHVFGSAGRHLGSEMSGGSIVVDGDAGIWAGAEMHGGSIRVKGNAGHLLGAAYRGSTKGMTSGIILVEGNAGNEIGVAMRRGLIAVGGSAGDVVGFGMIAGTILVFGHCGIRPGAGMRRGTLGLFGAEVPNLLPSFRYACSYQPQVLKLIFRELQAKRFDFDPALLDAQFDVYHGDLVTVGRGEVFFRQSVASSPSAL